MSDIQHAGSGPNHRAVELGVALAMVAFGAIIIVGSLKVGIGWGDEGPRSGFFPFYIALVIIAASIANLVTAFVEDRHKVFADWSQLFQVLSVVIPTAVYVSAVPWAGIYLSSLVLNALLMMWFGRNGAGQSVAVSVGTVVAIFLMFEKWFLVPLPKGPIEDFFGL